MTDQLERIRDARDTRAFAAVARFVFAATGWFIVLVMMAASILKVGE